MNRGQMLVIWNGFLFVTMKGTMKVLNRYEKIV